VSIAAARRVHCLRPLLDVPEDARWARPTTESPSAETTGSITDAMVGLLRERTGRGPPNASTTMEAALAIVTLGDCLTKVELTLLDQGRGHLALQMRNAVLDGMRGDAIAAVEAITGRRVAAYLATQELDPDLAIIAFHFL
jgi:uncharacterized protein YbcI